jgi:lysozyme
MINEALSVLCDQEGFRGSIYTDSTGNPTTWYGRNLNAFPFTTDEAQAWTAQRCSALETQLMSYGWWVALDPVRQSVITNMSYNMGLPELLSFHNMIVALTAHDYVAASQEMLNSKWATQVKTRAQYLAQVMAQGKY